MVGFSQHDLRELHAFFEVEKTSEWLRKELANGGRLLRKMFIFGVQSSEWLWNSMESSMESVYGISVSNQCMESVMAMEIDH